MNSEQLSNFFKDFFKKHFGDIDPSYDPNTDVMEKGIYRRHEIIISDYLMSFKDSLIKEFLENYDSLENAIQAKGTNNLQDRTDKGFPSEEREIIRKVLNKDESVSDFTAWKSLPFKYQHKDAGVNWTLNIDQAKKKYPSACKLIEEFGDDCPIANYSYLSPNSILHRHTGPENRTGEFLRIHIPLIVPEGDVFFEVNGEEIRWDDIFGFNNQFVHSAHNLTDKGRLIFLIDIRRSRLGLPPGKPFNKDRQFYQLSKPFVRK